MLIPTALFICTLFLAYANGANDNFKGVATLLGSNTTNYKTALVWATATTIAGSLFSIFVAQKLIEAFSGKGLVPLEVAQQPTFLLAVAIGAGLTVMLATLTGFPISTTHSILGALVGAGFASAGSNVNLAQLGASYLGPLLFSPFIAAALSAIAYIFFRKSRIKLGITKDDCICITESQEAPELVGALLSMQTASRPIGFKVDKTHSCKERYSGSVMGIGAEKILDIFHFLSAGAVSFARGLNDTPKIMGLILISGAFSLNHSMLLIALAMALGGLLNSKKVAHTMSHDIAQMNHGQGFTANLITSALVIFASKLGMPVSTTHVSVGSIFGIGAISKAADYRVISKIAGSWILTLPIAGILAALTYLAIGASK